MENLNLLDVDELDLGLTDLLGCEGRAASLEPVAAWRVYAQPLRDVHGQIGALPAALRGRPLADALAEKDAEHDGFARALYYTCEAIVSDPKSSAELVAAARRVREVFVPTLSEVRKPYAAQAAAAKARRADLLSHEADLRRIPVAGERTLYDVASDQLTAGDELDGMLTARSHTVAAAQPAEVRLAARLRSRAVSLLTRLRGAMAEEVALRPDLPRDLDARVFGKLDELARLHRARTARPTPAEQPTG